VARRPDRRHDYLRHRFVIPSRAAAGGTSGLAKRSNRIVHPRPESVRLPPNERLRHADARRYDSAGNWPSGGPSGAS
ncbi:hypothetical protein, partial [Burkholderia humptydooensis]|uniref:hypothetical protein n=1 Tax=Burkholderia humptydooensis TaxID=430531 RepID=UPI001E33FD71